MTDQLASARGHLKNARNRADEVRSIGVHKVGNPMIAEQLIDVYVAVEDEINAALDVLSDMEDGGDLPEGDWVVMTQEHATLKDAHGPYSHRKATRVKESIESEKRVDNPTRAKVVKRDRPR